jgi:septum formation protein
MAQILNNRQELILASQSPRRRVFFQDLGLSFSVVSAEIEEKQAAGEIPIAYTRRLAFEKANNVAVTYSDKWIVGVDTVVCFGERILEKPVNDRDALRMLMCLRGQEHVVHSSICLLHKKKSITEICSVTTRVQFWDFSEEIARKYVATGEPLDKAGSYGIQGKGAFLVREIHGSYSNVVGLPLVECVEMFVRHGIIVG